MDGYWGPVTASKDWCELNYAISWWVAEWWNTLSSTALCAAAVVGLWASRRRELRFTVAFGLLFAVGLGSIAFHAVLSRETQLLDQLPMWFLVCWLTWVIVDIDPSEPAGPWFRTALGLVGAVVPAFYVLTRGQVQWFTFHTTFFALEVFCLARVGWLSTRSDHPRAVGRYLGALTVYLGAVAIWLSDLLYCEFLTDGVRAYGLPRIEWHAVWHVGVAAGFLWMVSIVARLREELSSRS